MENMDTHKGESFDARWRDWGLRPDPVEPDHLREIPIIDLKRVVVEPQTDFRAEISLLTGIMSVFIFLLAFLFSPLFYTVPVLALLSAVLGVLSYSRIKSNPLALRGAKLAVAGAAIGGILLAAYMAWFAVLSLDVSVKVTHILTATPIA
jgi:hypothetical protein